MPPVLHVALDELVRGAQQQLLAQQLRLRMDGGHRVLQLVAEAERAAGLVVAAARPHAAGDGLVHQPAVGENVQLGLRRLDAYRAQRLLPVRVHGGQRLVRGGRAPRCFCTRLLASALRRPPTPSTNTISRSWPGCSSNGTWIAAHGSSAGAAGRTGAAPHRRRRGQRAVAADEFGAVAGVACGSVASTIEEGDAAGELGVVGVRANSAPLTGSTR
jgi:hypothetical protein